MHVVNVHQRLLNIVIVGAGYAGVSCALRLARRQVARRGARILLVNPGPVLVERIRLHQAATGQVLRERRLDALLAGRGVELLAGHVESIDLEQRTISVGGTRTGWDRLVLATGSHVDLTRVPGAAEHAVPVEPGTAQDLRRRLEALRAGATVAVVGGGLTGIETATEVAEAFPQLQVHLVCRGDVARDFSAPGRRHVMDTLARLGVKLHERTNVRSVKVGGLDTDQAPIGCELCIWTAGFAAAPPAREAGWRVNERGQVLVDPMLRSVSHPLVYVAGDAGAPVLPPGQPLPMGCKSAMPMGAHVADNLARELRGEAPVPFDYALLFYCVSLGRRDGLIQWADADGRLTGRILTGRRAALFKEFICRSTVWALRLEAKGYPGVVWKKTGHPPHTGGYGASPSSTQP